MGFSGSQRSRYHVGSLERGLSVLEYMATVRRPVRLLDVVQNLNINFTCATRMCRTLNTLGFIRKDELKQYHLSPKVLALGFGTLRELKWRDVVELILKRLYDQVQQTVNMGILSGPDVLYLIRLRKQVYTPFDIQIGTKLPLYCTALGKSLLAFSRPETVAKYWKGLKLRPLAPRTITDVDELKKHISAVKTNGYSLNDEESAPGVLAVGCPVLDAQGFALMAINVTVGRKDYSLEKFMKDITPKLLSTASDISKAMIDMNITQADIGLG